MSLTKHFDWFGTVAASCRRVEQLFLDQGCVWGRKAGLGGEKTEGLLRVSVRVCKHVHVYGIPQSFKGTPRQLFFFLQLRQRARAHPAAGFPPSLTL